MNHADAIDTMQFRLDGGVRVAAFSPVLVGVVGSGNLEVLLESSDTPDCAVEVQTSARGFATIWRAVMDDFHARYRPAHIRVSIQDMGATPAVVSLRLQQAMDQLARSRP